MIFGFGSKRREQRDRDAGLVFGWRSRDSTTWSTFLSSALTAGLVVFSIYAVQIPLADGARPRRDRGSAVELFQFSDQTSSHVLSLIQEGSGERDLSSALFDVMKSLDSQTVYVPEKETELRPIPEVTADLQLPAFSEFMAGSLPAPSYEGRLSREPEVSSSKTESIVFRAYALGDLAKRVPAQILPFPVEDPASFVGQDVRAHVAVSASGAVESAWIVEPQDLSNPMAEIVQKWLPRQVFLPGDQEDLVWGELIFQLRLEEGK